MNEAAQDSCNPSITGEMGADDLLALLKKDTDEPYRLRATRVLGKLDLESQTVKRAVDIQGCEFSGPVDLRYCRFEQAVNFSGCTFCDKFISGDSVNSHTVYAKDLICSNVCFNQTVSFNGVQIEGSAYFTGSVFKLAETEEPENTATPTYYTLDFTAAVIEKSIEFDRTVCKGPVSFNALKCNGSGFFSNVRFETDKQVNFAYATFDFFICEQSQFWGKANFRRLTCNDDASFFKTRFQSGKLVDFAYSRFDLKLQCEQVTFKGKADFRSTHCSDIAVFRNATFESAEGADFRYSYFGGSLDLRDTFFAGSTKLAQVQVSQKLRLEGSCFEGSVALYHSTLRILEIADKDLPDEGLLEVINRRYHSRDGTFGWGKFKQGFALSHRDCLHCMVEAIFPFKRRQSLDLTGLRFELFHGGNKRLERKLASKFVQEQDPRKFNRDPYLQLERYYRSNEDEAESRRIHYDGHVALHNNALDRQGLTTWSLRKQVLDTFLKWSIGYGHRAWLLLLPILLVVVLGMGVFWSDEALRVAPGTENPAAAQSPEFGQKLFERSAYSLDLFLPVVDLRYEKMWAPKPPLWRQVYAVFHSVIGWALVAVILAWLTGIIKNE